MNPNRKYSYFFWGFILLLLSTGVAIHYGLLKKNPLSGVVILKVNEHELKAQEFSEQLAWALKDYDIILSKDAQIVEFVKNKIIDDFIKKSIVEDWAQKNNVSISSSDVQDELFKIRKNYPDDASFQQVLSDSHQTLDEFKNGVRLSLLQKKVFVYFSESAGAPNESEQKLYYDKNRAQFAQKPLVRLRQIVFEKEDAAQQLYHNITPTSKFADLAKKFSVAPEARRGGDTGWIEKGTLEIFDKAFNMKIGQRSGVLKSPYGYHIFEVVDKKPESSLKFEDAKDRIIRTLRAAKEQTAYTEWLEAQVRDAKVFKNTEALKMIQVKALGD